MKKLITSAAIILLLAGCATRGANYVPMVDTKGRDANQLAVDTSECQAYARQQAGAGDGAVAGAIIGALFMAALAPGGYRNEWARSGALVGGASGAVGATESQETIIRRCLAGRGYSTLN